MPSRARTRASTPRAWRPWFRPTRTMATRPLRSDVAWGMVAPKAARPCPGYRFLGARPTAIRTYFAAMRVSQHEGHGRIPMAEITAALVRDLRDKTGAGMMDCKKALVESGGDM